jgi:ATP-binding cassette subfamily F protein uup
MEVEQGSLQKRLADPSFYQASAEEKRTVQTRLAALDAEINTAMQRWEALELRV